MDLKSFYLKLSASDQAELFDALFAYPEMFGEFERNVDLKGRLVSTGDASLIQKIADEEEKIVSDLEKG